MKDTQTPAESQGGVTPLRPVVFAILLVLQEGPAHGYAVMKAVNESLGRRAVLGPGSLYRNLKEMRDLGWIEHQGTPEAEDQRRRIYRISASGREVARTEAERLRVLVARARELDLLGEEAATS